MNKQKIKCVHGNEQAFGFYARYSFLPRKTVLKQVKKPDKTTLIGNCLYDAISNMLMTAEIANTDLPP